MDIRKINGRMESAIVRLATALRDDPFNPSIARSLRQARAHYNRIRLVYTHVRGIVR